jgi:hypothetical protein
MAVNLHFRIVEQSQKTFAIVENFDFVDSCVKHVVIMISD